MIIPGVIASSVIPPPKFGAIFPDESPTQSVNACQALGITHARMSMIATTFGTNNGQWDAYTGASPVINVLLNINNEPGSNHPYPYPTNLTTYRNNLNALFNAFNNPYPLIAVCENEVVNRGYYGTNLIIANYIAQLEVFCDVCNQRGILCADGSVPLEAADQIRRNGYSGFTDIRDLWATEKLMDGTGGHPVLNYSNLHLSQPGISTAAIVSTADFVRGETGKQLINNEWVMLAQPPAATLADFDNAIAGWIQGHFLYSIYYDGGWPQISGDRGQSIADNGVLTSLGIHYRDQIAPYL